MKKRTIIFISTVLIVLPIFYLYVFWGVQVEVINKSDFEIKEVTISCKGDSHVVYLPKKSKSVVLLSPKGEGGATIKCNVNGIDYEEVYSYFDSFPYHGKIIIEINNAGISLINENVSP